MNWFPLPNGGEERGWWYLNGLPFGRPVTRQSGMDLYSSKVYLVMLHVPVDRAFRQENDVALAKALGEELGLSVSLLPFDADDFALLPRDLRAHAGPAAPP
ncbi:hypothetical protein [Cupriavidus necator]|uniref:hypothetical protein n=1 Tax=Cupriavidus necator TaxID=106590 RepID=UPI0039C4DB22